MTTDPTTAHADWIDGHPQLEAIAAAVWERCRTEGTSLVVDDPRNIAVAALAAVLPVPSAPTTDPAVLRERVADVLADADGHRWVPDYDRRRSPAYQAYLERADRVVGLLAAYDTTMRAASVPLTASERGFLGYALMLAADQMANRPDEFGPDDEAALERLRRLAAVAQQSEPETARTADGATALRDVADFYERVLEQSLDPGSDPRYCTAVRDVVMGLRCRAAGAQQQPTTETRPLVSAAETADQIATRLRNENWHQRAQGAQDVADMLHAAERIDQQDGEQQ
ncbi:hypothetical protein [Streptomyces sp. YIM S03343]